MSGSGWDCDPLPEQALPDLSGGSKGQLWDGPEGTSGVVLACALVEAGEREGGGQDHQLQGQFDAGFLREEGEPRLWGVTATNTILALCLAWGHALLPGA